MPPHTTARHAAETIYLAAPLIVALLAQMAMGATDTVLLGRLGSAPLAAGGLGTALVWTVQVVLQGLTGTTAILVAQARGAGRDGDVPAIYWTGMLLTALLAVPTIALCSAAEPLLRLFGEPPELARDVGGFVAVLRWAVPGVLLEMGVLRSVMPAVGLGPTILWSTVVATIVNGFLCWALIHGAWIIPALGLRGAALSTVLVQNGLALTLLVLLHRNGLSGRFVARARPRLALFRAMLHLGVPAAGTLAVEAGLFLAVSLLLGLLGPAALAAQQVAFSVVSIAFMAPLGLAQAANLRVGHRVGAGDGWGARRAGIVAILLGAGFELAAAAVNLVAPRAVVGLYLDPAETETFGIAVTLLGVAGLFQVADGVQCVAGGALRGLGDTRVPFGLAAFGYWGIGFPAAWYFALHTGAGAIGAWWGLALGLVLVAGLLTRRFLRHSLQDPVPA